VAFIAGLSPDIPYSLPAFSSHVHDADRHLAGQAVALRRRDSTQEAGLENVRLGNTPPLF